MICFPALRRTAGRVGIATTVLVGILLTGCQSKPLSVKSSRNTRPTPPTELRGAIAGYNWHIPWRQRDPKNPRQTLPVLIADAREGALTNTRSNPIATLRGVRVLVYQEGREAATLTADQVTADRRKRVLKARGHCRLVSHRQMKGTVLTSERMTWSVGTQHVLAEGDAQLSGRTNDGVPVSFQGNRIRYDVAHDNFEGN